MTATKTTFQLLLFKLERLILIYPIFLPLKKASQDLGKGKTLTSSVYRTSLTAYFCLKNSGGWILQNAKRQLVILQVREQLDILLSALCYYIPFSFYKTDSMHKGRKWRTMNATDTKTQRAITHHHQFWDTIYIYILPSQQQQFGILSYGTGVPRTLNPIFKKQYLNRGKTHRTLFKGSLTLGIHIWTKS